MPEVGAIALLYLIPIFVATKEMNKLNKLAKKRRI